MKKIYYSLFALLLSFLSMQSVNAQNLPNAKAEVPADATTSATFENVDGATVTIPSVGIGEKVMLIATIEMSVNAGSQDAGYLLVDATDGLQSDTIIRTATVYKGIASNVYIFTATSSGSHTYNLQHKVAGGATLTTKVSLAAVKLYDGTDVMASDVKAGVSPQTTSSTTWAEVTGSATSAITSTQAGGFLVMASVQSVKTAGASVTGEWKIQYKQGAGAWTDFGYPVQRNTSGTGKGVANLVAGLTSSTPAGTYYFRVLHRITDASGGAAIQTQACNIIAVSFATSSPSNYYQVFQGAKSTVQTTSGTYTDAIDLPARTTATATPELLMLGQFNMEANAVSDAPKFDFSINAGAFYDGLDHLRYVSSNSDLGSAAMVAISPTMAAATNYILALRHASNPTVPIRHIETTNIFCIGVALEHNAFEVYPITVNATSGIIYANYSTLKAAFDKINDGTHKGDINISINTSTTETASAVLYESGKNMGAGKKSSYNYVNIFSTGGSNTVSGNFAAPLIDLDGADNVTIDGRVSFTGAADLVFEQLNTTSPTIRFKNSASSNTVQYAYIKGGNSSMLSGVIDFSTSSGGAGNDDNIIQYNKITCSGSNKPTYTVYSHGSSGILNTGNQILNNEFYDLFGSGAIHNVVFVSSYSTEFTVSGNSFYETATVTAGTGGHYSFIHLENSVGNGFVVTNNYLGGTAAQCGGTPLVLNSAYGTYFETMDLHVGIAVAANVSGNTVSNINYSSAYDMPFIGIEVVQGNANVHDNIVGATSGTGAITVTNTTADCVVHGIFISTPGDVTVNDNDIGAITTVGSGSKSCSLVGIGKDADVGAVTITNNTIGNSTANNMIASSTANTAVGAQYVIGVKVQGTGNNTVNDNTIQNLTNAYTGTVSGGSTFGIQTTAGVNTILRNTVKTLSSAGAQDNNSNGSAVIGICQTSTSASVQTVSNNTIYNLDASSTTKNTVVGIYFAGGAAANIVNANFVYGLTTQSTDIDSYLYGIQMRSGTATVTNNIINIGTTEALGCYIIGMYDHATSGVNNNFYFNTIYVGGTTAGTINSSQCMLRNSDASTSIIKGNIFYNARTGGSGGDHFAVWYNGLMTNLTINNNDLFSADNVVGRLNGTSYTTLGDWQTATGQEANSVSVNPLFDNAGGNLAVDYFVSEGSLALTNPTTVTTDYSGVSRGNPTLIGALERHDFYWQGDVSTDYNTAANWDQNVVPMAGANIFFNANPDRNCVLDQDRVIGDLKNTQNTDILVLNGHKLSMRGSFDPACVSNIIDADGALDMVEFTGLAAQTYPANTFVNNTIDGLIINNSYGVSLPQSLTVSDLSLTSGALSIGANTLTINDAITITAGTITGGASSNITIGGAGASTSLPAVSLNNLTLNRTNGISLGGNVSVAGALDLTDGVLIVGANTLTYSGSAVTRTSGSINASNVSATMLFDNATQVTLPASVFSAAVNNLTIQNTGGLTASSDFTVNGVLNLVTANPSVDRGLLDMTTYELSMGANATTIGLGDVEGIISRTSFPFNTNLTFGNQYNYFYFPSTGLTMPTKVSAKLVLSAPSWDSDAVLRIMSLIRNGGDASVIFRGTIHYTDGELNGNAENRLSVWRKVLLPPAAAIELGKSAIDETDNWLSLGTAPLSLIKDSTGFGASEFCVEETDVAIFIWDGSESTDWTDGNNWDGGVVPTNTSEVLIPDANTTPNDPTLPASTTILSLSLESGAILNGGTATVLTIAGGTGAFANAGGTLIPETSKLIFTNAAATWSGEMDLYDIEIAAAASIVPVAGSVMRIAGTLTNNATLRLASVENTVEYNGDNQTVLNPNGSTAGYYNLILSGSGTKTMPATALNIYGDFTVSGTATVSFIESFDVDGNMTTTSGTTVSTGVFSSTVGGNLTVGDDLLINAGGVLTLNTASKEVYLESTAKLDVDGTFVASTNGYITFESEDAATGQILNNSGIITPSNSSVRLKKEMRQSTGWYFMSFPYEVPLAQITDASTGDPITIGGMSSSYDDIYVQKYDGAARDAGGAPNVSGAGAYWADISPETLVQYQGYIIATERDKTYYFNSLAGEDDLFGTTASVSVVKATTNASTTNHSWNLLGNPFSSAFNLLNATQTHAPFYYYNGSNYVAVASGDTYKIYPFSSFFFQAFGASPTLDFATAGRTLRNASIVPEVDFDEIDLSIVQQDSLSDRLRIRLRTDATVNFDPGLDGFEFRSLNLAYPQLYAKSNNLSYSIHSLAPQTSSQTIPLTYIAGTAGTYSIKLSNKAGVKRYSKVTLKDYTLAKTQDLLVDSVYTFTTAKGTVSTRMAIILEAPTATQVESVTASTGIEAKVVAGKISFEGLIGTATVELFDVTGRKIGSYTQINNYETLPVSLLGVYLLKVKTETQVQQFKLFVGNN